MLTYWHYFFLMNRSTHLLARYPAPRRPRLLLAGILGALAALSLANDLMQTPLVTLSFDGNLTIDKKSDTVQTVQIEQVEVAEQRGSLGTVQTTRTIKTTTAPSEISYCVSIGDSDVQCPSDQKNSRH
jgi:hypothetical protein